MALLVSLLRILFSLFLSLTHTHTRLLSYLNGDINDFYTVQAVCAIALHLLYT